jgi:SAM-dependent methyltransferase
MVDLPVPPRGRARRTPGRAPVLTARTADRHDLYQRAVQDVARECRFLARTFERLSGRRAGSLREDFCGTALLSAEWVKGRNRSAVGVDRDREVLAWGRAHNLAPLATRGTAVRLLRQDVRAACPGRFDLAVALNFSYFVFRTREDLGTYFAAVRRSLAPDGILVLDAYGGWQSWRPQTERRRLRGFTYVWDQARVDPIDHAVVNHIHFEFPDGSRLRRAFSYHWRLWTIPEIGELLAASGFARSSVWWEERGEGGIRRRRYRRRAHAAQEPAWVAYVIAEVA